MRVRPTSLGKGRGMLYAKWADFDMAHNDLNRQLTHLESSRQFVGQLKEPLKSSIPHKLGEVYRQLAAQAESQKNDAEAIKLLTESLSVADEPLTRMALAAILTRTEQVDKAIENYKVVVRVDGNNLEARHHLIDLLYQKKNYADAQVALLDLTDKEKSVENYQLLARG